MLFNQKVTKLLYFVDFALFLYTTFADEQVFSYACRIT